jgi:hypothetical protein
MRYVLKMNATLVTADRAVLERRLEELSATFPGACPALTVEAYLGKGDVEVEHTTHEGADATTTLRIDCDRGEKP